MDIKKLFEGVAVVIDDNINKPESNDLILRIVEKLENKIPLLTFEDIPENKIINNFSNISFILLDWELFDNNLQGTSAAESEIDRNFRFIRKLRKITFSPIFIFSNETPDEIIRQLNDKNLYNSERNNYIFVKRKQELFTRNNSFKMFGVIKSWLEKTPSIYVLKEWEKSLNEAKNKLFWDFYNINHKWPSVLQKTFTKDGSDVNYELGNFIFKNIMARTEPIKFDEDILKLEDNDLSKEEIRKVLEAERFIKNDSLPHMPFTGDLYRYRADGENEDRYYLNIRPECDIARKSNPEIYCLKGRIVNENDINPNEPSDNEIRFIEGAFIERINKIYLPFILSGKILEFSLNDIKIKKWNTLKDDRMGRILPPYITAIQQKYAFYLHRQGLPAIPEKAIKDE